MSDEPTIFAKASGGGRAAVAIIRLSGSRSSDAVLYLGCRLPLPRAATLLRLRDPASGEPLDHALVLWFPAPSSFTGEDVVEFHLHGGRAVVDAVLRALSGLPGLRPAEAGEFTRRAYRNGKMDLTEVEGLADLIEAETEVQRRLALRHLEGTLGRWAASLREALIEALALAEAMIDFAEEDDLAAGLGVELRERVEHVTDSIVQQLAASAKAEAVRDGLTVAILGAPNVGKSTLLNRLAGRDVAIVSAHAGTTRDVVAVDLDLHGHAVRLIDTAGLRETSDPVEREGIRRARDRAASADLVLWLDDGAAPPVDPPAGRMVWHVSTKADVARPPAGDFLISAETGLGLDDLMEALAHFAESRFVGAESALVTRLRHRQALDLAVDCLRHVDVHATAQEMELVAEDLRGAMEALAALVGTIGTEAVLGSIFSRFCIGK